jgi:excisionase family DNA binding protein
LRNTHATERLAYRVDEACRALGISRTTLYKLIASGELRTVMVGGRRLIPLEAAEALVR